MDSEQPKNNEQLKRNGIPIAPSNHKILTAGNVHGDKSVNVNMGAANGGRILLNE